MISLRGCLSALNLLESGSVHRFQPNPFYRLSAGLPAPKDGSAAGTIAAKHAALPFPALFSEQRRVPSYRGHIRYNTYKWKSFRALDRNPVPAPDGCDFLSDKLPVQLHPATCFPDGRTSDKGLNTVPCQYSW